MGRMNSYPNTTKPSKNDELLIDGSDGTRNILMADAAIALNGMISLVMHRNTFRGKNLGNFFTDDQKTAIRNGTFDDLYVGDFWDMNGIRYRIVDINYWLKTGDVHTCNTNHLVVMPDKGLYQYPMNETDITNGGYIGSKMYLEGLEQAKNLINTDFGESYILKHDERLVNAITDGYATGFSSYDSTIELPNEPMMYGCYVNTPMNNGSIKPVMASYSKTQLAAFSLDETLINIREGNVWLRDVVSNLDFACVEFTGKPSFHPAHRYNYVRPVFGIHG